ncbi:unnamed protein product [Ceutorhynchus assimilis]|uniref:Kinesin motor domain-containing protein n=1 Tax=Ceutorhynchus assimilis TaxID=467358 RepID=A0A9N9QKF1_9CUCU|nr:unnamed protein product [Ceutorhynchus assimilis]
MYREILYDLMSEKSKEQCILEIREDLTKGIHIPNLTEIPVESAQEILDVLIKGSRGRATASTNMNATSSRSHSIFTINLAMQHKVEKHQNRTAKLHLVDLAGSERPKKTGASGTTFKEDSLTRSKRSPNGGCTCRWNCKSSRCGCRKFQKSCTSSCRCKETCENQEKISRTEVTSTVNRINPESDDELDNHFKKQRLHEDVFDTEKLPAPTTIPTKKFRIYEVSLSVYSLTKLLSSISRNENIFSYDCPLELPKGLRQPRHQQRQNTAVIESPEESEKLKEQEEVNQTSELLEDLKIS